MHVLVQSCHLQRTCCIEEVHFSVCCVPFVYCNILVEVREYNQPIGGVGNAASSSLDGPAVAVAQAAKAAAATNICIFMCFFSLV